MATQDDRMKADWDARAQERPRFFIASSEEDSESAFDDSGRRDVEHFFAGLEGLLHPEATVLDLGCGLGRMDRFVAPSVGRLIGVDVSGVMVAQARERLSDLANVTFLEGDGWTLPVPDASVDLVFSHIVLQHVPRPVASSYFRDVLRVLRIGGAFAFQVPEANETTPADPPEEDTFEMRFYREEPLRAELESLGFAFAGTLRHWIETPLANFNQLRMHVTREA
jgi:ubiquinone/menaquinone biosynthesis C-methylase UbiE